MKKAQQLILFKNTFLFHLKNGHSSRQMKSYEDTTIYQVPVIRDASITLTSELGKVTTSCDDLGRFFPLPASCDLLIWGESQGSVEDGDEAVEQVCQPR